MRSFRLVLWSSRRTQKLAQEKILEVLLKWEWAKKFSITITTLSSTNSNQKLTSPKTSWKILFRPSRAQSVTTENPSNRVRRFWRRSLPRKTTLQTQEQPREQATIGPVGYRKVRSRWFQGAPKVVLLSLIEISLNSKLKSTPKTISKHEFHTKLAEVPAEVSMASSPNRGHWARWQEPRGQELQFQIVNSNLSPKTSNYITNKGKKSCSRYTKRKRSTEIIQVSKISRLLLRRVKECHFRSETSAFTKQAWRVTDWKRRKRPRNARSICLNWGIWMSAAEARANPITKTQSMRRSNCVHLRIWKRRWAKGGFQAPNKNEASTQ